MEMDGAVGLKIRIQGIVRLLCSERCEIVMPIDLACLNELMIPSPSRGRSTAYAVINRLCRHHTFVSSQPHIHLVDRFAGCVVQQIGGLGHAVVGADRIRYGITASPTDTVFIRIGIVGNAFPHGNHFYRLRIGIVALVGALDLKIIPVHQVLLGRMTHRPADDIGAGQATGFIFLLDRLDIIDTVVSRYFDAGRSERGESAE